MADAGIDFVVEKDVGGYIQNLKSVRLLYFLCCTHNMHGVQRRRQYIWWQWPFKLLFDGVEQ